MINSDHTTGDEVPRKKKLKEQEPETARERWMRLRRTPRSFIKTSRREGVVTGYKPKPKRQPREITREEARRSTRRKRAKYDRAQKLAENGAGK